MIARIWHGVTSLDNYENYSQFLIETAIPDYKKTAGLIDLYFLRKIKKKEGHFTLITFWDSIDSIVEFAGQNFEIAKYYPEDDSYLLEKEKRVQHHEVFAKL